MNTNRIKYLDFLLIFVIASMFLNIEVKADERNCNYYATQGQSICESNSYQGYKCAWDSSKKGGGRCYKSDNLTKEVKENITSCTQIKESETCQSSKVAGSECIWRQGACYEATNDGSNDTIIADDQNDRNIYNNSTNNNTNNNSNNNSVQLPGYVGENICSEDSVQKILKLVGYILIIVKVLVPLIIIIIGTIDLFQAVIGKDEKALTKNAKNLALRVVLGVFIFFIPTIVNWAFDVFYETAGGDNNKQCITCVLEPNDC